ncbi:MAG: ATP-binding protein [Haloarculaceae archaeon]
MTEDTQLDPRHADRFLKLVLETGGINGAIVDTDLRRTWIHSSAPGPPADGDLEEPDAELFSGGMSPPATSMTREAVEAESRVEGTFSFVDRRGQHRYRAAAEPLYGADDALEGAMFAAIDLSDSYRLLERTTDAVYTVDSDWTITFWNDQMADRTGIAAADVVGTNFWDTIGDSLPEAVEERYRTVMETGEPVEFEQYLPEPFEHWVEIRVFADDDGLSIYSRDISDRKRRQRQLESQLDTLDVLNDVLRHDIRNDLQLVLGYADVLADRLEGDERAYAENIKRAGEHAVELTKTAREITEFLFADEERAKRMDLRNVLESEIENVRASYSEVIIQVETHVPDAVVVADELLDSVFRNLLKNAVRHNDKEVPKITVRADDRADEVEIRIEDNGPGIPDELKEEIFGKGEKGLESTGTGIGLYLVRTLVESYGGDVWVEDNEPEGAAFVVVLPKLRTTPAD